MHFALVHGAYHGAWCWDEVRGELQRAGHSTSAVDLPCEDPDAGAERYAAAVLEAIPAGSEDVVLVGHSLAGLTVPLVAGRTSILATIYLCALLPVPAMSFDGQRADMSTGFVPSEGAFGNPDGSRSWPERGAIEFFYQDCEPALARAAARRLRSQHWRITQEVTPLLEWPRAPAAYILCADDRAVSRSYSTQAARAQLHIEPIELPGDHSPFLSRPRELATALVSIAEDVSVAARDQTG